MEDVPEHSGRAQPPRAAASTGDAVENALAVAAMALSTAMGRAPAEGLAAIAEALTATVRELEARRKNRA